MNLADYKSFRAIQRGGIQFLILEKENSVHVYSQGVGRLHNWGAWMTLANFEKRLKDKTEPLKPLD